ncbi:MAG: c-type cytochrome [Pseudomonadota bacterium]|nr:c-type cytochrome [Pseudomonadota bacterium]|tara:strand:- start:17753 stop:18481 length:729 start_codon:yes stop_codon:yes gene_type:complete
MQTKFSRTLALGALFCGFMSATVHAAETKEAHEAAPVEFDYRGDADKGKALSAVCGACHGADGNSMIPTFPKIAGQHARYVNKQLHDIKNGDREVPEMAGIAAGLSDQDMADLSAYFEKQSGSIEGADPELVELGEKIYRMGKEDGNVPACTACHQPDGQGLGLAGYPKLSGQHADYTAKQLMAFRAAAREDINAKYRTNDGEAMIMRMAAKGLSDKEILAVSAYVSGLMAKPEPEAEQAAE